MQLEETQEAREWLRNFELVDREIARQILRSVHLVSSSTFERGLHQQLSILEKRLNGANAALFAVEEPPPKIYHEGQERRLPGSSAGRVKHLLEGFARQSGPAISVHPTVASMKAQRIRNIVLVDDYVGSGERLLKYWRTVVSPSVKSWISYGWTTLWLVTYANAKKGLRRVVGSLPLRPDHVLTVLPAERLLKDLPEPFRLVAAKYGAKTQSGWRGYGGVGSLLVFQHGCPNNALSILWSKRGRFKPLFPGRGVPAALHGCFDSWSPLEDAESLWSSKQYRLALRFAVDIKKKGAVATDVRLLVALGLSSTIGEWVDEHVAKKMLLSLPDVASMRARAYQLGLLKSSDNRLSPLAVGLLQRARKPVASDLAPYSEVPKTSEVLYYPVSCGGVVRC